MSTDFFYQMLNIKSHFCQIPTSHTHTENFERTFRPCFSSTVTTKEMVLSVSRNHSQAKYTDVIRQKGTIHCDVPNSSSILHKDQTGFILRGERQASELIFQENQPKLNVNATAGSSMRHIGFQTDYRDESAQTDPFSPAYTISSGEHPEVFTLSDFTYGKGLPATAIEISFIERLRARRVWEQDHRVDMTRARIVIEREIREWQIREKEIKMLQETRHQLFTKNLHTYIDIDEDVTQKIVDLSLYRHEKQLQRQRIRLESETSRDLRRIQRMYRLQEAQINAMTSYRHLGIIGTAKRGEGCFSSIQPPWHTRTEDPISPLESTIGTATSCPQFDHLIDRRLRQSGMNIFKLEQLLPKNALETKINASDQLKIIQRSHQKKWSRRIRDLEKAHEIIEEMKRKKQSVAFEDKPLRFLEKIEIIDHSKHSSTTPTSTEVLAYDHHHHRQHQAIINLQNYLRGITVQSKIDHVRHIRQDLLEELRTGLEHDQVSSSDLIDEKTGSTITQIYDYFEGETMADMFDFLSKELLRLQCEQTIHLFIFLADRNRHQREAAETGHRTRSIDRQRLEERTFKEMFSLDLSCDIESYLEDLILQTLSKTADEQARLEVQQITETLVKRTNQIDHSSSALESSISELVHYFLFPTVHRILTGKQCLTNYRK